MNPQMTQGESTVRLLRKLKRFYNNYLNEPTGGEEKSARWKKIKRASCQKKKRKDTPLRTWRREKS